MPKDIVLTLDGTQDDETLLAHAEPLANLFGAHILALQVNQLPELITMGYPVSAGMVQDIIDESRTQAKALAERLQARLARLEPPSELRRLEVYPAAAGSAVASQARAADLYLAPLNHPDSATATALAEAVLFSSGRAVLYVPRTKPRPAINTVLVGWNDSREAARALAEAMPFLLRAKTVIICTVSQRASEETRTEPAADIARHLDRHGVDVELRTPDGWSDPGEALLNEARTTGADLIVIGAYGHSRLREWVLGGVTRHLLTTAPVPVLAAH